MFKLTQRSSVNEYLLKFERLSNHIVDLPPSFILSCFIFDLNSELRCEVQALQPISLQQAISLAKLQEDKLEDHHRSYQTRPLATPSPPLPLPPLLPNPTPTTVPPHPKPQVKRLTPEEMARKRELGLCYNCDDKWGPTHRCGARFFLCYNCDPDPLPNLLPPEPTPEPPIPSSPNLSHALISFNALSATTTLEALRLYGFVHHHRLTVLIDGGSMHNFIQSRVAKFLHLPTTPTNPLQVTVDNGTILPCDHVCYQTPLILQGCSFSVDLHVLPISGVDIVLGIQWLK